MAEDKGTEPKDFVSWIIGLALVAIVVGNILDRAEQDSDALFPNLVRRAICSTGLIECVLPDNTPAGSVVRVSSDVPIFEHAVGDRVIASTTERMDGQLLDGPDNGRWFVDFFGANADDGWVRANELYFSPNNLSLGDRITVMAPVGVWGAPDGRSLYQGVQERNALGTIVEDGPFQNLTAWWRVDFDTGPDGWVSGASLEGASLLDRVIARSVALGTKISLALSLLLLAVVIYLAVRIDHVKRAEKAKFNVPPKDAFVMTRAEETRERARWGRIEDLVNSEEPGNWKLAIIEADVMLDKMLLAMGYVGDTVGDRLKAIEASDFETLNKAWEAHKVRNMIAHEGTDFLITQREAKRIVALFGDVFREFDYI